MTGAAKTTAPVLGIVCGMAAEARALGRWSTDSRIAVGISGARPDRAEAEARRLVAAGVRALLSWGIAGALDEVLAPGGLVLPGAVLDEAGVRTLLMALGADLAGASAGPCLGVDRLIASPAAKRALRRRTGAVCVDMESHRVARVAAAAGLPCAVLRAISDPVHRALPRLAANALSPGGRQRVGAVLAGLALRPGDLPGLIRAGRDSRRALAALSGVADAALPAFLAAAV